MRGFLSRIGNGIRGLFGRGRTAAPSTIAASTRATGAAGRTSGS